MKRKFWILAVIIISLDQFSKYFASFITYPIPLFWKLQLNLIHNTGAGFGILKDSNYLLAAFSVIVISAIIFYRTKIPKENIYQISAGLILGGAAGNLIDRILLGYVIDFIDFQFFPAFNIADSAITLGAIALIIYELSKK